MRNGLVAVCWIWLTASYHWWQTSCFFENLLLWFVISIPSLKTPLLELESAPVQNLFGQMEKKRFIGYILSAVQLHATHILRKDRYCRFYLDNWKKTLYAFDLTQAAHSLCQQLQCPCLAWLLLHHIALHMYMCTVTHPPEILSCMLRLRHASSNSHHWGCVQEGKV